MPSKSRVNVALFNRPMNGARRSQEIEPGSAWVDKIFGDRIYVDKVSIDPDLLQEVVEFTRNGDPESATAEGFLEYFEPLTGANARRHYGN